jgi:hypothetical protein
MGSGAVIYVPGFIKIGSGVQTLIGGGEIFRHTHTWTQSRVYFICCSTEDWNTANFRNLGGNKCGRCTKSKIRVIRLCNINKFMAKYKLQKIYIVLDIRQTLMTTRFFG